MALSVIWFLAGCQGGKPDPRSGRILPTPKLPPAYPVSKDVPIDPQLQASARHELESDLHSSDADVRAHAIEALQETTGSEYARQIAEALSDPSALVRYAAGLAAGQLKLADAREQYLRLLDDHDAAVRVVAHFDLHQIGDFRHSHELEKLSRDPEPRVRGTTAIVLGLIGDPSGLRVLQVMRHDPHPAVRQQAAASMWRLGSQQGLSDLVGLTLSPYQDDQMMGLLSLAEPRNRIVIQHVRNGLVTDSAQINLVAARAMGILGCDEGYGVATEAARSKDPKIKMLGALAFGAIGRSDAQGMLGSALSDPDVNVRLAAAKAILQLKPNFIPHCSQAD